MRDAPGSRAEAVLLDRVGWQGGSAMVAHRPQHSASSPFQSVCQQLTLIKVSYQFGICSTPGDMDKTRDMRTIDRFFMLARNQKCVKSIALAPNSEAFLFIYLFCYHYMATK